MKKGLALFFAFLLFTTNVTFAESELYYIKNANTSVIAPFVTEAFTSENYNILKQNPFYGVSKNNPSEYAIIILQQTGDNIFYYYNSENNVKINKYILKQIKKADIDIEESKNVNILNIYDNLAMETINSSLENKYTFSEPQTPVSITSNLDNQNNRVLKGYVGQINKGTTLNAYLQTPINTMNASVGDVVTAVFPADFVYNNSVVFPQGSVIYGTLTKARHATYGSQNGRVVIDFNKIVTPENQTFNISTEKIDFTVTNEGKAAQIAKSAVAGAVIGGLSGLLIAALASSSSSSRHYGSTAAISAGIGAGAALIGNTAQKGVDAEIPVYTDLEIVLSKPLNVTINY